jgi:hypothetical protein
MPSIAKAVKRILRHPLRRRQRSAEGYVHIIRDEPQLARSASILAHYGAKSPVAVENILARLWSLKSTALFVQVEGSGPRAELVVSRRPGHQIIATGQKFRVETATCEPGSTGAYLVARQYRQLGFYETPPSEQAVVVLRIIAGSGRTYLVDVPHYVSHVTLVVNNRALVDTVPVPQRGELRYSFGADRDPG